MGTPEAQGGGGISSASAAGYGTESVLHRAIIEHDVLEAIGLLITVAVTGVQEYRSKIVVGVET